MRPRNSDKPINDRSKSQIIEFCLRTLETNLLWSRVIGLVFALILSWALFFIFQPSMQLAEERLGALGWTLSPDTEIEERIIIVAIDEKSIAEVGPWPWPRETIAELTGAIDAAGAQLQLHDIVYSEPKPGDAALIDALTEARGSVIAQVPVLPSNSVGRPMLNIQSGSLTGSLSGIDCGSPDGLGSAFPETDSYVAAHDGFSNLAKGHIVPLVNLDGSITKQPAVVCVEGAPYPALAISALLKATEYAKPLGGDRGLVQVRASAGLFGAAQELSLVSYPGLSVPLDDRGNLRISYAKAPESYQAISAVDLLKGNINSKILENAWVLLGATAFGLDDVVPTPYSGAAPGVELQARVISSVLDMDVPYTSKISNLLSALFCGVYAVIVVRLAGHSGRFSGVALPVAALGLPLFSIGLHGFVLNGLSVWLGWLFPALFALNGASVVFLIEQARIRLQRNRVLSNLSSYLPSDVAEQIAYTLPNSDVNAERRDVTLLSADLRNFSAFTEARPAEESAAVLHFFFQRATQIVEDNGGKVHEFTGDGLLAVWDGFGLEEAENAYQAGLEMLERVNEHLVGKFSLRGLEGLAVGIGIEQGPALIGSIGPAHRRSHTLLGDTVTITLRIQEMTSDLAQPILFGECVARYLSSVKLQSQGSYLLAGLHNPHTLFAIAPIKAKQNDSEGPKLRVLEGGRG